MNNSFSLVAIDLRHQISGHILKTLKKEIYFFDKRYAEMGGYIVRRQTKNSNAMFDGLYGENISVQAIVGKNGSGKSSLLEIIYRIINNFTCSILNDAGEQTDLMEVNGLNADLYFEEDGILYCIACNNRDISLTSLTTDNAQVVLYKSNQQIAFQDPINLREICRHLFYTVVTNYAPQSMISNDYVCEHEKSGKKESGTSSWMKYLFHKNDGYLAPICLVPFRDINGAINAYHENELTLHRLSSIFLYYQLKNKADANNSNTFVDGYELDNMHYTFNAIWIRTKISAWTNKSGQNFKNINASSVFKLIIDSYGFWNTDLFRNELYFSGCVYLVLKILNILDTYPSYKAHRFLVQTKRGYYSSNRHIDVMQGISSELRKEQWMIALSALKKDDTHITYKVRQTVELLKYMKERNCDRRVDWLMDENGFTFEVYMKKVWKNNVNVDFEKIHKSLPPSFFDIDMKLRSLKVKNVNPISFSDLSSGEKQYLCVLSAYIYHILNLHSVAKQENRVYYTNIMLIMDEVEICFHPDYQRQFINRLVSLIKEFHFNYDCRFYILMATHSPFILSDMSKDNILYLEKGKDVSEKIEVNPFCANVNDILDQSFFMDQGFSGEFATLKVKELIVFLNSKSKRTRSGWTLDNAKYFIKNIIGDPIMQSALLAMYNQKLRRCNE